MNRVGAQISKRKRVQEPFGSQWEDWLGLSEEQVEKILEQERRAEKLAAAPRSSERNRKGVMPP
jgi:hypothetical protein